MNDETAGILARIQNDQFDVGADLCRPERLGLKAEPLRLKEAQAAWLEATVEQYNARLAALKSHVLPGGSRAAATLHVARSIVRRAEREIVEVAVQEPLKPAIIRYMNRLSDLLFVLARIENLDQGGDRLWKLSIYQA